MTIPRITPLALLLLAGAASAWADEEDTRLLLDRERAERTLRQQQRPQWQVAAPTGELSVEVNGQRYRVQRSLADLEPALYVAINTGQWNNAGELAAAYRELPGHKEHLALMAEGLSARHSGDYHSAVRLLEHANAAAPDDLRVQMELARIYAEDQQDRESVQMLERTLGSSLPAETRELLHNYVSAVQQRSDWQGSLALGVGYNSNINQGNGYERCSQQFAGYCLSQMKLPDPIASSLLSYDLVLSKRIALSGHHNVLIRPVSYGTYYHKRDEHSTTLTDYSDSTNILYLGYQYASARQSLTVLPLLENYHRDGNTSYRAPGVQADWSYFLSPRVKLGLQAGAKRYKYQGPDSRYYADYTQRGAGVSLTYYPEPNTSIYGGVDYYRKSYALSVNSSQEQVWRAGVFHQFETAGLFANLMVLQRDFSNDDESYFYGVQREDQQRMLIATLGASKLAIHGAYPELRFKRTLNDSNSVFNGYQQSEITLQVRKHF